ncbi:MAG: ABC transporter ATP-binding protein [Saprospiraceae bacterium]
MKELAKLNRYFVKYKWHFLLGIVFISVSNYFRILQPQYIRDAMDLVVAKLHFINGIESENEKAAFKTNLSWTILKYGALVVLWALLMGLFMFFMRQTIIVMSRLIENDLREDIFIQYEKLNLNFYKQNNTGDMMSRITEDVSKVRMYLGPALLYGINLISLFALTIYAMFSVNFTMAIWSLLPLPILSYAIYYVSDLIHKRSSEIQKQIAHLNSIAQESYSGIRVIKTYNQQDAVVNLFAAESDVFRNKSLKLAKINAFFAPTMIFLIGASVIITIYVGGLQSAKGEVTAGNIAEFVIYISMLTWPVTALGWISSLIQQAEASQKRINEFLQLEPAIKKGTGEVRQLEGDLTFENVSFAYPETGIQALKNISFSLKKGEKMAIIGRTGSGKSTIMDLLVRLYDVSEGRICLDGKDIRELELGAVRDNIGYVPQDVFLFSDSIYKNIAFGNRGATEDQIQNAARYASVHKDILGMANGYGTVIGERGVLLSGGQKQRVSIARAIVKNPSIMLLDDCLSAVDSTTEHSILQYMKEHLQDKTSIVITHRIYGLLEFDKIIVLEGGEITAMGTHEDLLSKAGYYADLYERQSNQDTLNNQTYQIL